MKRIRSNKTSRVGPQKASIFFARTYRRLLPNYARMAVYYIFFVLPCVILFLFSYSVLTYLLSKWTMKSLTPIIQRTGMAIYYGEFLPYFGGVYFVSIPDKMPSFVFILSNLFITLVLWLLCKVIKAIPRPVTIYLTMGLFIHLVSCVYFLFCAKYFPYTLTQYSELYMKQQVGIWLSFITIAGLASGVFSKTGLSKYTMVLSVTSYSLIFGCLRYVLFLAFLSRASSLYMAVLLFVFGPFFDFLYLVSIYSVYINSLIIKFEDRTKGAEWQWS